MRLQNIVLGILLPTAIVAAVIAVVRVGVFISCDILGRCI